MNHASHRPGTQAVHGGQEPCPLTGAVMPPVYLASTYAQSSPGEHKGYEYTRSHNPTRYAAERCIAVLEGTPVREDEDPSCGGFGFASGLAAISTVLDMLESGDHVVAMDDLYGGTHRLFRQVKMRSQDLKFTFVDPADPDALQDALTDRTRLVWVETPTNPMLKLANLEVIATEARARGILSACDNTFCSPMLQKPLDVGFDLVMHSGTKYLGGHSDCVGGFLVAGNPALAERVRFHQNSIGSVLGPFDSYLMLRGMKTLAVRMRQHCKAAQAIAEQLEQHDRVGQVIYPGLSSHPQHELAQQQMKLDGSPAGGGMITIVLDTDLAGTRRFLETLSIFTLAESLGGVESLVNHPAIMTHASMEQKDRELLGISDSLVRISVGIEDIEDLQADLDAALKAVG
ncbi:MAG: PLP-dependent aspartate aminotransferase family protein [Planctomycetota bacterium]|nr:PLP-dependent aspartate aminotransferase family protein [Planctomycetota bacterium]